MREISDLNINEGGLPVTRRKPTIMDFEWFETKYQIRIPEELRLLLSHANGGHPELDTIVPVNSPYSEGFAVNRFYHLVTGDDSSESLAYAKEHWWVALGVDTLPFAGDGGGNEFFIDWGDSPPSVKLCLHDVGIDVDMIIVPIAPTFEEFIDNLKIDTELM